MRQNVDSYAKRSMPLCMSSLYEELHRASHLKYDGRFQLQGFLKGIGFTLQDSLVYVVFERSVPFHCITLSYLSNTGTGDRRSRESSRLVISRASMHTAFGITTER